MTVHRSFVPLTKYLMVAKLTMIDTMGMTMFKRAAASHMYRAFSSTNTCFRSSEAPTLIPSKSFFIAELAGSTLNSNKQLARKYTSRGGNRKRNCGYVFNF